MIMSKHGLSYERYQRQIILSGFGEEGQQKLQQASVLVVGAGGLGCPALQYLVAAGVGKIGIVDDDIVSVHNLHRQVLYTTKNIGRVKADVAAKRLKQMNPEVQLITYAFRFTNQNAIDIIGEYQVVLDASDNFATRYLINDACVLLKKPLVYGAISQFEGQVAIFNAGENSANYRDLFPQPPKPESVLNCAESGVLGVLPGIIGAMQATEVIKLITGIGRFLSNQLLTYNALTNETFVFDLIARKETITQLPKTKAEFEQMNYEWLCGNVNAPVEEIDAMAFSHFIGDVNTMIVDVREVGEKPQVMDFLHQQIPLSVFNQNHSAIKEDTIVLFCQSGSRSLEAAKILSATFVKTKKIYTLKGGIINWIRHGKKA